MDAINSALGGLMAASNRFNQSAQRLVSGEGDMATELVNQVSDEVAFKASIAVIKTADEMTKRLLDIKA